MPVNNSIQRYGSQAGSPRRNVVIDGATFRASLGDGWQGVLAAYLAQKDVRSKESIKTYRKELIQYFKWMERTGRDLGSMTKVDILEYRDYLVDEQKCSSMTVAAYIGAVRGFYSWTEDSGLYPDIARKVRVRFEMDHVKMHLTKEQTRELLQHFHDSARDYAMVNLMLRCGLRTVEVNRANVGDIAVVNGRRLLYIQGKGYQDKKRWVVLREAAWGPIRDYLDGREGASGTEPLFVCEGKGSAGRRLSTRTIQFICKKGLRAIGLDSHLYSAHSLRHTTGVRILSNGGSVTDVQEVLGHASVDTSRIYLKSAEMELRLSNPAERFLDDIE